MKCALRKCMQCIALGHKAVNLKSCDWEWICFNVNNNHLLHVCKYNLVCVWPHRKNISALTLFPVGLRVSHKRQASLCQDTPRVCSSAVGAASVIRLHGRECLRTGNNSLDLLCSAEGRWKEPGRCCHLLSGQSVVSMEAVEGFIYSQQRHSGLLPV